MPKLTKKNPKLGKLGNYAVVRTGGKTIYLKDPQGRNAKHGTPEALAAYNRYCYELSNPVGHITPSNGEPDITVKELAAGFLDFSVAHHKKANYTHYRIALTDFLVTVFGDIPANQFGTKSLKMVRENMVRSGRLNRYMINDYVRRIATMFRWAVEEELVNEGIWGAYEP